MARQPRDFRAEGGDGQQPEPRDGDSGARTTNGNLALASGNLYSADREGGSLFGLQFSNPVAPFNAYQGGVALTAPDPTTFGTSNDPMVGLPIGGINVFGGGLALYNSAGQKVGGVGVSGDTSCTDHVVAWKLRNALGLDHLGTPAQPGRINGPAALSQATPPIRIT